jgi:uncharacterized protein YgbK (DUF1537 family)
MACVRIVADDLTGALDAACRFVGDVGPFNVAWRTFRAAEGESLAADTETRENRNPARLAEAAALLRGASVDIAFKKMDSLLRGDTAAEIAAVWASGGFRSCVIAPAFPAQGRITRGGRQLVRPPGEGEWAPASADLAAELRALGVPLRLARNAGEIAPTAGIYLCDAETDADLRAIAAKAGVLPGRLLWCGTAGLAGALARIPPPPPRPLPLPLLAVVGSNHTIAQAQVAQLERAAPGVTIAVPTQDGQAARELAAQCLARLGFAVLVPVISPGASQQAAAGQMKIALAAALDRFITPGSVMATGGETLRTVADILGAQALRVEGEREPGAPVSVFVGGRWDGIPVLSKSGAFAGPDFLVRLYENSRAVDGV